MIITMSTLPTTVLVDQCTLYRIQILGHIGCQLSHSAFIFQCMLINLFLMLKMQVLLVLVSDLEPDDLVLEQCVFGLDTKVLFTSLTKSLCHLSLKIRRSIHPGLHETTCHHTTTVLQPFFQDHLGEPVPEENLWTLWCKGKLTEADTLTIQLGATPSRLISAHLHHPPHIFYRPDALPAAQPTASKH